VTGFPAYRHLEVTSGAPYVTVVTLRRPPVNALSRALRAEFIDVIDRLQDIDDTHAIVLAAAGSVFCAGADIREKDVTAAGPGQRASTNRLIREGFFSLLDSVKPVIAAVQGGALGAGFVLAACCDLIIASDEAFFAMPEIDVGQGGGASLLQRILPLPTMRRMMLTGERIPAAELYRLGAVQQIVRAPELMPTALALTSAIAAKSPLAVRAIRASFGTVAELPARDAFRIEQDYTDRLSSSAEAAEARQAFFQKSRPT
jgi:enoyl-CoA hydratase